MFFIHSLDSNKLHDLHVQPAITLTTTNAIFVPLIFSLIYFLQLKFSRIKVFFLIHIFFSTDSVGEEKNLFT